MNEKIILQIKSNLWFRAMRKQLAEEKRTGQDQKIAKAITDIPISRMFQTAQHLQNVLLPKIKEARGEDHADYKFFETVLSMLEYSVLVADRLEYMEMKIAQLQLLKEFYQEQAEFQCRELAKYHAVEDILIMDGARHITAGVARRMNDLLQTKK